MVFRFMPTAAASIILHPLDGGHSTVTCHHFWQRFSIVKFIGRFAWIYGDRKVFCAHFVAVAVAEHINRRPILKKASKRKLRARERDWGRGNGRGRRENII